MLGAPFDNSRHHAAEEFTRRLQQAERDVAFLEHERDRAAKEWKDRDRRDFQDEIDRPNDRYGPDGLQKNSSANGNPSALLPVTSRR